jgi:hypothetical protein
MGSSSSQPCGPIHVIYHVHRDLSRLAHEAQNDRRRPDPVIELGILRAVALLPRTPAPPPFNILGIVRRDLELGPPLHAEERVRLVALLRAESTGAEL